MRRAFYRNITFGALVLSTSCGEDTGPHNGQAGELDFTVSESATCEVKVTVLRRGTEYGPHCNSNSHGGFGCSQCETDEEIVHTARILTATCNGEPCEGFRSEGISFVFIPREAGSVELKVTAEVDEETRSDSFSVPVGASGSCPGQGPPSADASQPPEADAGPACDGPGTVFTAPILVPGLEAIAASHPSLDRGELSITFDLEDVAGDRNVFVATRTTTAGPFGAPRILGAEVNGDADDVEARGMSRDAGFVFSSNRIDAGFDLFHARPGETAFLSVSSPANEGNPFVFFDELWFTSDRDGRWAIYSALFDGGDTESPAIRAELTNGLGARDFVLDETGRTIFFAAPRPTTADAEPGDYEIYRAARAGWSEPFDVPALQPVLSTDGDDLPGWLSRDGCRLYLTSNVSGVPHLYVSERR